MSNSADSPGTGTTPRFRPVRILTAGVFALAGLLFITSFNTAKGTNLRTDASLLKLSDLIQERSQKNGELDESNAGLRDDVESLAKAGDGSTTAEDEKLSGLERAAGRAGSRWGRVGRIAQRTLISVGAAEALR